MDNIIDSNSVEKSWSNWKRTFMSIMEDCVPKAKLPNRRNLTLLTKEIVRTIKKVTITTGLLGSMEDLRTMTDINA